MAAADNNVRPWRQVPASTSRRARRSGLARLLLQLLELLQLDRKLLLLLAASLMPACIIPVGPDWQDPPGEKNLPPKIVRTEPPFIGPPVVDGKFTVFVTAPNGDALFFKWFANFSQPFSGMTRVLNAEMD